MAWGNARTLPSGLWQARYRIKGIWRTAPKTFRTKGLADYPSLLKLHILPTLGQVELGDLSPGTVRTWRAGLIERAIRARRRLRRPTGSSTRCVPPRSRTA